MVKIIITGKAHKSAKPKADNVSNTIELMSLTEIRVNKIKKQLTKAKPQLDFLILESVQFIKAHLNCECFS